MYISLPRRSNDNVVFWSNHLNVKCVLYNRKKKTSHRMTKHRSKFSITRKKIRDNLQQNHHYHQHQWWHDWFVRIRCHLCHSIIMIGQIQCIDCCRWRCICTIRNCTIAHHCIHIILYNWWLLCHILSFSWIESWNKENDRDIKKNRTRKWPGCSERNQPNSASIGNRRRRNVRSQQ